MTRPTEELRIMHKHLTTPWEAKGSGVFAGKDCIAICDTDNADQQTYEAKARLMAAAPALLSILRDWLQVGNNMADRKAIRDRARAAIAQAAPAMTRHPEAMREE